MDRNDWYEAGDQIKKLVQDAVDSGDFSQIGSTISNVVNDVYQYTNREAADRIRRNMERRTQRTSKGTSHEKDRAAQDTAYSSGDASREKAVRYTDGGSHVDVRKKYSLSVPGEISGNMMKWTGYTLCGVFGLVAAILFTVAFTTGIIPNGMGIIFAALFGVSWLLADTGRERVGLAKRFRRYREILGERTYCMIEELAAATGKTKTFVRKDLKKMISLGFFEVGYLDRKATVLITDQSTYQQYLATQEAYEKRSTQQKEAERAAQKQRVDKTAKEEKVQQGQADMQRDAAKKLEDLPPQCREIIEEGRTYIEHIRECNERIEGAAFSAKLDRLELVITKIFCEVEKHPDSADDLKKMMSYYLPTTKKLLDAYCEMDAQPIAGDNIENTKREIEQALDTINAAFEKLLDDMFEETAWDISSDISVLHTMLAQEGLTGTDFSR